MAAQPPPVEDFGFLTPQEMIYMIYTLIIDNTTQQISPAKMRGVLGVMVRSLSQPPSGTGPDPVAYNGELKLKAKGYTDGLINSGPGIQPGDIVFGLKDESEYWDAAVFLGPLGANPQDRTKYEVVLSSSIPQITTPELP